MMVAGVTTNIEDKHGVKKCGLTLASFNNGPGQLMPFISIDSDAISY
jgi:hypothetical protein